MTYNKFIEDILSSRGRFSCGEKYHERHHITPKCLGGTNEESNLIDLFPKEHFIAHKLLSEENPDNKKLFYAFWMMTHNVKNGGQYRYICTPEEYEEVKVKLYKFNSGENAPMYGRTHTEETKEKISKALAGKLSGDKNPMYGKRGENCPSYGIKRSTETKKKLSELRKINRSVCQYDKLGNLVCIYENEYDACDAMKMHITALRACYKKPWHTANGYYWIKNDGNPLDKIDIPKSKNLNKNKSVCQYSMAGELLAVYDSISSASIKTNTDSSTIIRVCKGVSKIANGYVWRYASGDVVDEVIRVDTINTNNKKRVIQYSMNGYEIKRFNTLTEASKATHTSLSDISSCCHGRLRSANGFVWTFEPKAGDV